MSNRLTRPFAELRRATTDFDPQLDAFFSLNEDLTYELRWPVSKMARPGVLIYISPKPGAGLPEAWAEVLDEFSLVWVGAQNSGNDVHTARRVGMALLAPVVASQAGPIDDNRVVLSGFSGGGRVASMMMPVYPGRYAGALFICGANAPVFGHPGRAGFVARPPHVF